jgi:two-component system, response regulator YesN
MAYSLLLVDDDSDFREEFCGAFDDYEIAQAPDGETAIALLKKPNAIDLVMLDVMMPGSRGTDVLAEMKKIKPDIKIVILTGHSSKDVAVEALKNRADEYIEKPIDVRETREIIVRMLGEKDSQGIPDTGNIGAKVAKVKKFIERNYDKKVSLEDAAAHTGLSPKYLSRVFEGEAGTGFSDFKTGVKIKKAKEFLKQGYNINQISDKLGYQNSESFIRAFKKTAGSTPAEYRKANIAKKQPERKIKSKKKNKKTGRK